MNKITILKMALVLAVISITAEIEAKNVFPSAKKLPPNSSVSNCEKTTWATSVKKNRKKTNDPASALFDKHIVVDQFGYLSNSRKIAFLRDPIVGLLDAAEVFTPGNNYQLIDKSTMLPVFSAAPIKRATVSPTAVANTLDYGDDVWWFDFSSVTTTGTYFVYDADKGLKSYDFEISPTVFDNVLVQTTKYFYQQRASTPKLAAHVGSNWADPISHMKTGNRQDNEIRYYDGEAAATQKTLPGGWYDAGDYHRYTNWECEYILNFLYAYLESPGVWKDNSNIPESGNGVPDLLDEVKYGLDHLLLLQHPDGATLPNGTLNISGSVIAYQDEDNSNYPSACTTKSLYGGPSTSSSLSAAGVYAFGSKVFAAIGNFAYANQLKTAAIKAYDWALANPAVLFYNKAAKLTSGGTKNMGGGEQEKDDYGRFLSKMYASCFLYEITGDDKYKTFFESNYTQINTYKNNYGSPYGWNEIDILLYYTKLSGINTTVASNINTKIRGIINSQSDFLPQDTNKSDPYQSYMGFYGWGSNGGKAASGLIFTNFLTYNLEASSNAATAKINNDIKWNAAQGYVHYIHGANPLNMTYLSNMYSFGGDNCANSFFHNWYNRLAKWQDSSPSKTANGTSTTLFGPPPGFMTGGPNPGYSNNSVYPFTNKETKAKAYVDSYSTPNSWELNENSNGYQIRFIRLLGKVISISNNIPCTASISASGSTIFCNGGSVILTSSIGISYQWYKDAAAIPGAIGYSYKATTAGTYTVAVTDANNCTAASSPQVITVDSTVSVINTVTVADNILTADETTNGATYQWNDCSTGLPISGAVNQSYNATKTGSYSVTINFTGGCSVTTECVVLSTHLANTSFETQSNFEIYPNPTNGHFTIKTQDPIDFSIINESGQKVGNFKTQSGEQNIKLTYLANGIYFLVGNVNGKKVTKKFMVKQ